MGVATIDEDPMEFYQIVHSSAEPVRTIEFKGYVDGVCVGKGGVAFHPAGQAVAYCYLLPEARKHPVTLHRAALKTICLARQLGVKHLLATAEMETSPAAERWLTRLGFVKYDADGMAAYFLDLET